MALTEELLHDVFTALGKIPAPPDDPSYDDPYTNEFRAWVNSLRKLVDEATRPASMTIQFYEEDGTVDIQFSDGRGIVMTCDEAWRAATYLTMELKKTKGKDDGSGQD